MSAETGSGVDLFLASLRSYESIRFINRDAPPAAYAAPPRPRRARRSRTRSKGTRAIATCVGPLFVVRDAKDTEIEACLALAHRAAPEVDRRSWRKALGSDIENPNRQLVVAEAESGVVGYGRARLFEPGSDAPRDTAPRGYYLMGLFVRPDLRRAGIGAALTEARLRWINEGGDEAWFFANARNSASIALHRGFGFEEVTRQFSFPGLAFEGGEGILFRLGLPSAVSLL
jgi:ribosomal protein S18 acetylase RimI-like enzyme